MVFLEFVKNLMKLYYLKFRENKLLVANYLNKLKLKWIIM